MTTEVLPATPPPVPVPVSVAWRWVLWALGMVILPILPWFSAEVDWETPLLFMLTTGFAIVGQIATSIILGIGVARREQFGTGGAVGISVLLGAISLAVATAIWLLCMVVFVMVLYHVHGV